VTTDQNSERIDKGPAPGSLPFVLDTPELLRVRVRPAEFARIVGVSKQSVSRWIRAGKITLTFDGRIDMQRGVQQVLRNTDPGHLRARVLRQGVEDVQQLREVVGQVEAREAELRSQIEAERRRVVALEAFAARTMRCEAHLVNMILAELEELRPLNVEGWRLALDAMRTDAWELAAEPGPPRATATTSTGETDADWIAAVAECEAVEAAPELPEAPEA
jgi:hypothetical protein